jgi:glycosyltransferase involved in cell wall biosynthesis
MKLIFICGCLYPGFDGVGDYVRRLSGELQKRGHQVLLMAVYDPYVSSVIMENQLSGGERLNVYRIPQTIKWASRIDLIKKTVDDFDPDWLSLQFVPFSFQKKGLPFRLAPSLSKVGKTRKWHIMFHELWVGMSSEASRKFRIWGWLQRRIILSILNKLKPVIVHTQTRLYQAQLKSIGVKADYLPLFSNIPAPDPSALIRSRKQIQDIDKEIKLVSFGTIHPEAPIDCFAKELADYAEKKNWSVVFNIIGRSGAQTGHWIAICNANGIKVNLLGELPPEKISEVLIGCDLGIASTAYIVIEKSGVVAAMLEHGLPVICISKSWKPPIPFSFLHKEAEPFIPGKLEALLDNINYMEPRNRLSDVTETIINSLISL